MNNQIRSMGNLLLNVALVHYNVYCSPCCALPLIPYRKLRQRDASKYHAQLSLSILLMLLVFLAGIDRVEVKGVCITVSVLIHYFTLVSFMWMGAEALLMFQKLVIVFVHITTKFLVILSLVCWCESVCYCQASLLC